MPTAPEDVSATSRSRTASESVNAYRASGLSRSLMNAIASSSPSTVTIGSTGPKISSRITGASGATSASTVGAMYLLSRSYVPPVTVRPDPSSPVSRSKWRWFTIRPYSGCVEGSAPYSPSTAAASASARAAPVSGSVRT